VKVRWSAVAIDDLDRFRTFLASVNPDAAMRTARSLRRAARRLSSYPNLGEELGFIKGHMLRRLVVGSYEIWYEVEPGSIMIHRVWNTRQHR
jgi:plasmid stabilization system protein ParE